MGHILRFKARITPRTVDILLDTASEIHPYIHRLKAVARSTYGEKHETYKYISDYLAGFDQYINDTSRYFEAIQDDQAELSILGNLPLEIMEDRYKRLGQRIEAYKAKKLRRVIALPVEEKRA
jgi:hypothetical protein